MYLEVAPLATQGDILSVDELKEHLRVTSTDDNSLIAAYRDAALSYVADYCNLILGDTTATLYLDAFPAMVEIPAAPVTAVTGVTYLDANNVSQTLSTASYWVDVKRRPARVTFSSVPATYVDAHNAVQIACTIGIPEADVPESIKQAVRIMVAELYREREASSPAMLHKNPYGIQALLNPHRVISFK